MENIQTRETVVQQTTPVEPKTFQKKKALFRAHQVIWYIVGVIEVLLAFRIVLLALGANPASGFVNFVYAVSYPFAAPFSGIFGVTAASANVIEWSTFIAMAVYAIIGYGIVKLLLIGKPTDQREVSQTIDNK